MLFGTSSPTTINTTVETTTPGTVATDEATPPRPTASSGPRSSAAGDGSASMPIGPPLSPEPEAGRW